MAIVSMLDAVFGEPASSAEYNKLIDNIIDLDARLGAVVSGSPVNTRLTTLETRTTDTVTTGGIGNQRLADRFGTGVGTGANVTTGSATSQLTDVRARIAVLETAPAPTSGPLGWKGEVKRVATDALTAETVMETLSLALTTGRRYRVTWDFAYGTSTNAAPGAQCRIRISAAGGAVSTSSAVVASKPLSWAAAIIPATLIQTFTVASTATYQLGCFGSRGSGTVSFYYDVSTALRVLVVEDMGPV